MRIQDFSAIVFGIAIAKCSSIQNPIAFLMLELSVLHPFSIHGCPAQKVSLITSTCEIVMTALARRLRCFSCCVLLRDLVLSCVLFDVFVIAVFGSKEFSCIPDFVVVSDDGDDAAVVSAEERVPSTIRPFSACFSAVFSLISLKITLPFFQISASLL